MVRDRDVASFEASPWLLPTLVGGRRGRARTRGRAARLIEAAGLEVREWRRVSPLISAVVARRPPRGPSAG